MAEGLRRARAAARATTSKKLVWYKTDSRLRWETRPKAYFILQHTRNGQKVTRLFRYDPNAEGGYYIVSYCMGIREAYAVAEQDRARREVPCQK